MEIIGIALISNNLGQFLIDQRYEDSIMGGMWEFPGGKKKSSESIEKTIEREIKEELGIEIKVGEKLLSFEYYYSFGKLLFIVHLCKWLSGDPQPLASEQVRWVDPTRLSDFSFPDANTKIISALYKHLGIEK
jgi:A/G-specific adenine glycosylase